MTNPFVIFGTVGVCYFILIYVIPAIIDSISFELWYRSVSKKGDHG